MAKSAEQVKRESDQFKRASLNASIRQRLQYCSQVDGLNDLEFIERLIQQHNSMSHYYYGGFVLEPDVAEKLNALRKRCVEKLRKDAAFELECYEKRTAKGESPKDLERLRTQAANHTAKANSIQQTLDMIEAEKRRAAEQTAAEERKKAEEAEKMQKKMDAMTNRGIKIVPIIIVAVVLIVVLNSLVIKPMIKNNNIEKFHSLYEKELQVALDEYDLALNKVEYTELVPDHDLDYWATERINEYEVKVYLSEKAPSYSKIYEILREVSYDTNDYLLSNTYELLDDGEYVNDDGKETGFHQVITIFVFEDNSSYRLRYSTTLDKDGEIVYKWKKKSSTTSYSNADNAPAGECMYPECDHNRAKGKYYCHQHKCGEDGCSNSTSLLIEYCDQHNCTYGSCSAPRYKAAGSTYCQRHYIESIQD